MRLSVYKRWHNRQPLRWKFIEFHSPHTRNLNLWVYRNGLCSHWPSPTPTTSALFTADALAPIDFVPAIFRVSKTNIVANWRKFVVHDGPRQVFATCIAYACIRATVTFLCLWKSQRAAPFASRRKSEHRTLALVHLEFTMMMTSLQSTSHATYFGWLAPNFHDETRISIGTMRCPEHPERPLMVHSRIRLDNMEFILYTFN